MSLVLLALVVGGFVWALGGRWGEVTDALGRLGPGALLLSFGLYAAALACTLQAWRVILAEFGSPLAMPRAAGILFPTQLGKYLPGSVWPAFLQMRMGRDAGIPRSRMGLAFALSLGLSIAWGLVVGLAALPAVAPDRRDLVAIAIGLALAAFVLFHPAVLNPLFGRLLRLARRPAPEQSISGRAIRRASVWLVGFWGLAGLHVWVLTLELGASVGRAMPVAIGGFALAFSVGLLFVVLPSGAGAREALLILALSPVLATPAATAVALASRGLVMAADAAFAAGAGLLGRQDPREQRR